MRLKMLKGENI